MENIINFKRRKHRHHKHKRHHREHKRHRHDRDNLINYPFKGMIFEGGGPAGIAHLGAIKVFEERNIIKRVKYFVGSSAGSIIAGVLACNATYEQLYKIMYDTNFSKFKDDSFGVIRDITRLIKNFGWYKGDELEKWIGDSLNAVVGNRDITFREVYEKYGNKLIITVTDINLGKTIYLSYENNPDMLIRKAIKRSSLIPVIFKADKEEQLTEILENNEVVMKNIKHIFIDGGVLNNYPINVLDDILNLEEVVGFKLMSTEELEKIKIPNLVSPNSPDNIIAYMMILFNIVRNQALKIHVHENDWKRSVKIDVGTISSTDFDISNEEKTYLINQGYIAAQKYLDDY